MLRGLSSFVQVTVIGRLGSDLTRHSKRAVEPLMADWCDGTPIIRVGSESEWHRGGTNTHTLHEHLDTVRSRKLGGTVKLDVTQRYTLTWLSSQSNLLWTLPPKKNQNQKIPFSEFINSSFAFVKPFCAKCNGLSFRVVCFYCQAFCFL